MAQVDEGAVGATSGSPTGHLAQPQAPQGSELSPPVPQLYQEANPFRSLGAGPSYLCFLTIRAVHASEIMLAPLMVPPLVYRLARPFLTTI